MRYSVAQASSGSFRRLISLRGLLKLDEDTEDSQANNGMHEFILILTITGGLLVFCLLCSCVGLLMRWSAQTQEITNRRRKKGISFKRGRTWIRMGAVKGQGVTRKNGVVMVHQEQFEDAKSNNSTQKGQSIPDERHRQRMQLTQQKKPLVKRVKKRRLPPSCDRKATFFSKAGSGFTLGAMPTLYPSMFTSIGSKRKNRQKNREPQGFDSNVSV